MPLGRTIRRRNTVPGNGGPQTFDGQVGASSDDAFETSSGVVLIDVAQTNVDHADEWYGQRWTSVTIPNGATIDAATLDLSLYHANFDEPLHAFYAEDEDNPGTFTTASNDISGRTQTTATMNWDSGSLGAPGWFTTPSIVDIIQEIVDREGWSSGNALAIVINGAIATRDLGLNMYDQDTTLAAKLHVEFTA